MSDLIDRQAVFDSITASINQFGGRYTTDQLNMWGLFTQMIKDLPSAQQERKPGRWIYYPKASGSVTTTAVHIYPVCSECGCENPIANYCPNCGADMREGEQG